MATAVGAFGGMAHAPSKSGVWSWITTVDHKRIGILYGTTAICFFLVGGFEALLIRLQLSEARARSSPPGCSTSCSPCMP